ncbi:MAG: cysteine desulfurase [Chloroflexi bacterium]|nr:cysteine desulfurase [Chloroflexota bacterium]
MSTNVLTTPLDVEAIRADFPVLHQEVRPGVPLVYLDNAATSQKPLAVIDAMTNYYRMTNANVHRGIHKLAEDATVAYEGARERIARFINAESAVQIIYTRNATESINLVAWTWGVENITANDAIITTEMEHHANFVPWQVLAERKGAEIRYVPLAEDGTLDLDAYANMLDEKVKLVAIVHGSNVVGTINPIEEMIKAAHDVGAVTVIDGAQSVPHMSVDVQALGADFFAFSSHKMLGPTGIGVLYGKRHLLEAMPPYMVGGNMISKVTVEGSKWNDLPYKFEAGTGAIAEAVGLAAAIDYLDNIGMDVVHAHEQAVTAYALERLAEVPGITVIGPLDATKRGGLTSFTVPNAHPHDVAEILNTEGVAIRAGRHCAQPTHEHYCINATARASYYIYNTFDEVDRLITGLYKVREMFG